MTTEFGPRDVDLAFVERLSGPSLVAVLWLINAASDDVSYRYNRTKAVLSVSGESEDAGDPFQLGQTTDAIATAAMILPLYALLGVGVIGSAAVALLGSVVSPIFAALSFVLSLYAVLNVVGLYKLGDDISVVDHTTEPAPDALNELKERYQNGEIDEQELEREAAEVWDQ